MIFGEDRLHVELTFEGELTLRLSGDATSPEGIGAALGSLDERARASGATAVTIDVTTLEFMNSSCFKRFVSFLSRVRDLEAERRYTVLVRYDAKRYWQVRSLPALRSFAGEIVNLVSIGATP